MNNNLQQAVDILNQGGIVIFPTDTAFGIGCRIDRVSSIEKLFKVRKRPHEKAVPVLVSSEKMARDYVSEITPDMKLLMKKHWPGGLTIVSRSHLDRVPGLVRGGGENIGIRIPKHKTTLQMIKMVGVPILAPSANFAGEETPYKLSDLNPDLVRLVDFVLPGRCTVKKSSTVVDVSKKPWKILRAGAVKL